MLLSLDARIFQSPRNSFLPSGKTKENLFSFLFKAEESKNLPTLLLCSSSLETVPPFFHTLPKKSQNFPLQQISTHSKSPTRPLSSNLIQEENPLPLSNIFPTSLPFTISSEISKVFNSTTNQQEPLQESSNQHFPLLLRRNNLTKTSNAPPLIHRLPN